MQVTLARKQTAEAVTALTQDLSALVKHLLANTGRDFIAAVDELGLSLTQIKTFQVLSDAKRPLTVKALSEALGVSLPAASRAVDALVRRGEVARAEDRSDRRCKRVTLTARGRKTFERLMALRMAGIGRFVRDMDPSEREALAAALRPVAARLDA